MARMYFSELDSSAWPCQPLAGLLRHAVPGLQSCCCLPEHVLQLALSWQEPALAPGPDFPNPRWRLTCNRNISWHFGSINSSSTGERCDPPTSVLRGEQQTHPRGLSTARLPYAGLQTGAGAGGGGVKKKIRAPFLDFFWGKKTNPPALQRCFSHVMVLCSPCLWLPEQAPLHWTRHFWGGPLTPAMLADAGHRGSVPAR